MLHSRTPDKDQKIEQLFYNVLSSHLSPITRRHPWAPRWMLLCMLFASARRSASRKKWFVLARLDQFPWFNPPLNSTWVALQYQSGTKFIHQAIPKIRGIQNQVNSVQPCGLSLHFLSAWLLIMKNAKRTSIIFFVSILGSRTRASLSRGPG